MAKKNNYDEEMPEALTAKELLEDRFIHAAISGDIILTEKYLRKGVNIYACEGFARRRALLNGHMKIVRLIDEYIEKGGKL